MTTLVIASLALALVLTVLALVRQVQIRRALEQLLRSILNTWRKHAHKQNPPGGDRHPRDDRL